LARWFAAVTVATGCLGDIFRESAATLAIHHFLIMHTSNPLDKATKGYLLQTREQIQEDFLTLIDSDDDALNDKICQIVADNFDKFLFKAM